MSEEDGHRESLGWFPRCRIEKYSADQVRWLRRELQSRFALTGELLRGIFGEPEDGTVTDAGNGVTLFGLTNWAQVLTGTGGHPLAPGRTVFGVGADGLSMFEREHVHLSPLEDEGDGRTWYRPMDPGYPRPLGQTSIEGQATFTETEACFAWAEWCWASGPAEPVPHCQLRGAYAGEDAVMVNRKAHPAGYGVKEAGVAWVFRAQIELLG
jgi:hypothetical protein